VQKITSRAPKSSTMDINTLAQMTKLHPNVVIENSRSERWSTTVGGH